MHIRTSIEMNLLTTAATTTDKPALDSHNSVNGFTLDGSNIKLASLVEYHKMGLKLVPLSSDNKPAIRWAPIYEDPNFWSAEKLVSESSKFKNVATVFGKTHIKGSAGQDQNLNSLDCDSQTVYSILATPIEQIQDSALRSRIENLFSKTEISAKRNLLIHIVVEYMVMESVIIRKIIVGMSTICSTFINESPAH